ncbi:zinc finger BED domain-containing protein RICESLEEPER 2-like [Apium graveolens]|uniref:zinc finger BED domain-containing protein RICESLEEPER 2-like n=1 Tax=Apium graveolens TaxID=4045 RepID=UPI003D7B19F3
MDDLIDKGYQSLSDDEADFLKNVPTKNPTTEHPSEGSSKFKKQPATKRKRSKHQKVCVDTKDIRQMFLSSSEGSMALRNTLFAPQVFIDLITNAVIKHNLPLHFVDYEGIKVLGTTDLGKENFRECISSVALDKKRGLRQDVLTRWNSTFLMLESAIYYRHAFTHLQLTDSNYKHGISDDEWDKVEGICKFLSVFYNVTRLVSGSKYPTANLYFPNVFLVELTLIKAVEDRNYIASSLAERMRPKFNKYWKEYSIILAIAVIFDPRYKTQFVEFCYKMLYGEDSEQIGKLHRALKAVFDLYKDKIPSYSTTSEEFASNSFHNEGNDVLKEFDAMDEEDSVALEKTELDKYLEEKRLNRNLEIDILDY